MVTRITDVGELKLPGDVGLLEGVAGADVLGRWTVQGLVQEVLVFTFSLHTSRWRRHGFALAQTRKLGKSFQQRTAQPRPVQSSCFFKVRAGAG
jgi:hypothetical protein